MTNSISTTELKRLLASHQLFFFGRALFNIFFSLFLWSETNSIQVIAGYYFVHILAHTLTFSLSSYPIKKGNPHLPRILSMIGGAITFILLFLFQESIVSNLIWVAIPVGFFNGMYWISYQIIRLDVTNKHNRGNFAGANRSASIALSLLAPILGGYVVHINLFDLGYGNIFIIAGLCYFISALIGNIEIPKFNVSKLHIRKTFSLIKNNTDIKKILIATLAGNIGYMGPMQRLIPILIFDILQNEFDVGGLLSLFSLGAIITSFLFGKFIPYKLYRKSLTISGILFAISTLSLIGFPILITYIIYGFAREVLLPFMQIPRKVYTDNIISTLPNYEHHRVEYFVIREWFTILPSRIVMYGILYFVPTFSAIEFQIFLTIAALAIFLEPVLLRSLKTDFTKI